MMAKLSIPIQRSAIHRFKYLILLAALIFFAVGLAWFDGKREQSIFTSSYHGLQKQSFTKATISGRAQTTSGMKKFEETRFIPVAMHQSRGQFVLIMNNEDIFPIEAINEQINDKLVFILKRDR